MGDLFNLNNILMKKRAIIVETLTKLIVLKLMNVDVCIEKFSSRSVFRIQINFNRIFVKRAEGATDRSQSLSGLLIGLMPPNVWQETNPVTIHWKAI